MTFRQLIIFIFVTSLLSSNILWAGEGQLDSLLDANSQKMQDSAIQGQDGSFMLQDKGILQHVEVEHHDGHDCHMSAHLVGLSSQVLTFVDLNSEQMLPSFRSQFTTRKSPPPNKPPRA